MRFDAKRLADQSTESHGGHLRATAYQDCRLIGTADSGQVVPTIPRRRQALAFDVNHAPRYRPAILLPFAVAEAHALATRLHPMTDVSTDPRIRNDQVLSRKLSAGQQAMMAVGGAIGTGLFLGSGLAVNVAGPAVVGSDAIGAFVSLLLGAALTEMCVMHPTAGSFGVYAEMYISPFAGYAVRVSYWLMQVVATGGHMVAVSIYMGCWFPAIPGAVWIVAFSVALMYANSRDVATFGRFEYWFAMVKVVAIAIFVVLGVGLVAGGPWLAILGIGFLVTRRRVDRRAPRTDA